MRKRVTNLEISFSTLPSTMPMQTDHPFSQRRRFSRRVALLAFRHLLFSMCLLTLGRDAAIAQSTFIAYAVPANTPGNQTGLNAEPIGMDFDVDNEIIVTRLGVFDAGSDDFADGTVLTARLWDRSQSPPAQLVSIDFPATN